LKMSFLTCLTCQLAFYESESQKVHYKSDWHKYNLKRKIVQLPPVSVEEFKAKVEAQQALVKKDKENDSVIGVGCKICNKKFRSYNAYTSHLNSKKHKDAEKKELQVIQTQISSEELDVDKDEELTDKEKYEIMESKKLKAVTEARNMINQPILTKRDPDAVSKKKKQGEIRRRRWCEEQMRLVVDLKETQETDEDQWEDDDDEDWEDISDSEDFSDVQSEKQSVVSETSDVSGIMSRIKYDSDADIASIGSQIDKCEHREIGLRECLFCPQLFASADDKIVHMSHKHSFFIPELQYVSQLDSLLIYLGYKIGVGNVCIWCNCEKFLSLDAVRSHMIDKGHTKMFVDGEASLEFADFYDFSSTYDDDEEDENMEVVAVEDQIFQSSSSLKSDEEEFEMILPSGARIGNRKLMRYYKQNYPTVDRGFVSRGFRVNKLMNKYQLSGWAPMSAKTAAVKKFRRDIKYVQHMKNKYSEKLATNNNKTMMKHFRCQVMF